jgi:hypothetical protein
MAHLKKYNYKVGLSEGIYFTIKDLFTSIPNNIKAKYSLWTFLHLILLMASGNLINYNNYFYPIDAANWYDWYFVSKKWVLKFNIQVYDYSEFLIYVISPIILYVAIRFWKSRMNKNQFLTKIISFRR